MQEKKLIIVDVSNFIFRAFYAIRPLNAPDGTPVNAVYGVLSMFLKLISEHKPSHMFLARDSKGGSFRNVMYSEYKANRKEPPEDLKPQFKIIDELIEKMNLPTFMLSNYEADDLIGSACIQWQDEFDQILIASGDKDLMQFVNGKIKLLDTMKDRIYEPQDVEEKMGVPPHQIVDYLSMTGDTSDNIPGIRGVGHVGAVKLLKEYGSIDEIIKHKDQLKNKKIADAFNNDLDSLLLSKKLVQIAVDVDLNHTCDETKIHFSPSKELLEFLTTLGFKSFVQKLSQVKATPSATPPPTKKLDDDNAPLSFFALSEEKTFETKSELPSGQTTFYYFPVYQNEEDIFQSKLIEVIISFENNDSLYKITSDVFIALVGDKKNLLIGERIKRDVLHAKISGWQLNAAFVDIGMLHFNLNAQVDHSLGGMILEYFHKEVNSDFEKTLYMPKIYQILKEKTHEYHLEKTYRDIDEKIIPILAQMEKDGVNIDPNFLKEYEVELQIELDKIQKEIHSYADESINLNSPKQVGFLLFEKLNLPVVKKTKSGYSTDADVMETLVNLDIHTVPKLLVSYREIGKILSTYVKALPKMINEKSKRLHTHFNLIIAQTGRLSSTAPNLQNIPIRSPLGEKVRQAFTAIPGHVLLSADYSQIELRLLAHFANDQTMIQAFNKDIDIHAQTASEVLGVALEKVNKDDRSLAKAVNFGLMYGQSSFGLASTLKISRHEATAYIEKYFMRFSSIQSFLNQLKEKVERTSYSENMFGRRRYLPEIHSNNRMIKAGAERMAINGPIQGTAADLIKIAMIQIFESMAGMKSKMILQVHDELIFEVPEEEIETMTKLVREGMENAMKLKVPLKVDIAIGLNWQNMH